VYNIDMLALEKAEFDITHQEAGGFLLKWWELPLPIVESALYHHRPFDKRVTEVELVCCVHIAQKCAWDIMKENQDTDFYPEAFSMIGLDRVLFEYNLMNVDWDCEEKHEH
jgi:HD-like signal output (HDOD) protein